MRAFITGITGFAGSHLTEHLLASGDRVLGCSHSGCWRPHTPAVLRPLSLLAWDVTAGVADHVRSAVAEFDPDCLFHLAAISVPRDCGASEPSRQAWEANVHGTQAVLRLAATLPRRPRVLLASSCHVYAPVPPARPLVREDAPTVPAGGYGKTKLAAESELLQAVAEEGLDAVIARAFQHAGPRQDARLAISEWCRQLVSPEAERVRVQSLSSCFDLSDVRDVVRAYRLLAIHGRAGEIYNVGSGVGRTSGDLLAQLQSLANCRLPVAEVAPAAIQQPLADTTRLRQATGWQPWISVERTLQDTLAFWRAAAVQGAVPANGATEAATQTDLDPPRLHSS
ncbi:MAG: NAD(P)-dependent oxidoreductase [Candidatus Anammoximicrobium sp.]|nr:NAD(P)-dependent oxidoreductase [Candidatus Anammoximicrobium sp.]